jgi:hypothetical protein
MQTWSVHDNVSEFAVDGVTYITPVAYMTHSGYQTHLVRTEA